MLQRFLSWLLPYKLPSVTGVILVAQGMVSDRPRTGLR